jgi:hypothetical protein
MSKSTSVATKASTAVADASLFDNGPTGFENVTSKDLLIPRIAILQALSPQINKKRSEYIEGAEQGDFCDTGTGDVFKESIDIVPCYYATQYLEWAPRDSGKGLIANHGTNRAVLDKTTKNDRNQNVLPDGNYIVETMTFFCLNLSAGGRQSFIPLSSAQLKAGRRWLTLMTNERLQRADGSEFTPPIFYRSWKATSIEQSNAKGSWMGWKFEPGPTIIELDPTKGLLERAKAFFDMGQAGLAKGDLSTLDEGSTTEDDGAM